MKDIDKMSPNELRAEVRVLRGRAREQIDRLRAASSQFRWPEGITTADTAVEAQDDGEGQAAALSEIDR